MSPSILDAFLPIPATLDPSHPLAYLAHLPPSLAYEFMIAMYVLVATAVIHIWDVLNTLHEDYEQFVNGKQPIGFLVVVYCISRLSTMAFLLYTITFETALIGDCNDASKLAPWLSCIALSSTSLLFFFRVRDIYNRDKCVTYFFFFMWLAALGASLMSAFDGGGWFKIGYAADHCLSATLKPFASMRHKITLVNDSFVSMAISFRLMQVALSDEERRGIRDALEAVACEKDLRALARSMLRNGQGYYLITTSLVSTTAILFHMESISLIYRSVFQVANLALVNVMAGRVYRRAMSGEHTDSAADSMPFALFKDLRMGNDSTDSFETAALV